MSELRPHIVPVLDVAAVCLDALIRKLGAALTEIGVKHFETIWVGA